MLEVLLFISLYFYPGKINIMWHEFGREKNILTFE